MRPKKGEKCTNGKKLKILDNLVSSGLTIEEPIKRRPRITTVGVPLAFPEEEIYNCIYEQNIAISSLPLRASPSWQPLS